MVWVQYDVFPERVVSDMHVAESARSVIAQQLGVEAPGSPPPRKEFTMQWRPLATQLHHGKSDPRRDVAWTQLRMSC